MSFSLLALLWAEFKDMAIQEAKQTYSAYHGLTGFLVYQIGDGEACFSRADLMSHVSACVYVLGWNPHQHFDSPVIRKHLNFHRTQKSCLC